MIVSYNTFELFFVVNQVIREIMNTEKTNVSQINIYMYIFTSLCVSRDTINPLSILFHFSCIKSNGQIKREYVMNILLVN